MWCCSQLHLILCDPVWPPGLPLPMDFSRQKYWTELPFPPPGNLPDPGIKLTSPASPALAGGFLTTCTTWEAPMSVSTLLSF